MSLSILGSDDGTIATIGANTEDKDKDKDEDKDDDDSYNNEEGGVGDW